MRRRDTKLQTGSAGTWFRAALACASVPRHIVSSRPTYARCGLGNRPGVIDTFYVHDSVGWWWWLDNVRNDVMKLAKKAQRGSAPLVDLRSFLMALPLFVALGTVGAQAVSVDGLGSVVRQLKATVRMPLSLPVSVPDSLTGSPIYARVLSASPHEYTVQLASTKSCTASRSCLLGTVAAYRGRTPSALGRAFKLANGTEAYYNAPVLSWERQSVWYRLRLPGVSVYSSEVVARSFRSF